jgi:hypothetical protein
VINQQARHNQLKRLNLGLRKANGFMYPKSCVNFPAIKNWLGRVGVLFPPKTIHYANGVLNYLNLGRWLHDRGLKVPVRCATHKLFFQEVAKHVTEPVSYLEFGVFKGESLRQWSRLLKHPGSTLHGFDSFEGLPEDWGPLDKEYLNVSGVMPRFDDTRVKLFKGWFSETLPPYVRDFKPNPSLMLYLDADIYSSTILTLRSFSPYLKPGTVLMFDEFWDREHELRAFTEFLKDTPFGIECLAATPTLSQIAFRITTIPPAQAPAGRVANQR